MRDLALVNIAESLYGQPWAITEAKHAELVAVFERRRSGDVAPASDANMGQARKEARKAWAMAIGAQTREVAGMLVDQVGSVAVLPLQGVITQRPSAFNSYSGGTSAEQFVAAHTALLKDPVVKAVLWDVDSPGGSVAGVPESAARLLASRGVKPVTALSNAMMASAAYWLASAADTVVASPSSLTGSIGVVSVHEDWSKANEKAGVTPTYITAGKHKVEDHGDAPLTDEARAAIQQTVDDYYQKFVGAVAKARRTTADAVRSGYGEGRVLTAERASAANLVDRIGDMPRVLRQLGAYD